MRLPSLFALVLLVLPLSAQEASRHNAETGKQLDIFNSVFRTLDRYYVDTLNAKKCVENALDYMLEQLDPYTEYFPEDKTDDLKQLTTGKYAGVGAVISPRKDLGRCVIAQLYEGMPAAEAGLRTGDVLLAIDGKDLGTLTTQEPADYSASVSSALRGEPGTTIAITVRRPGSSGQRVFKVTRRSVTLPSVTCSTMMRDSVGVIMLDGFTENTAREVRRAFVELKQQGARRLLLDLRGNPGGLMDQAVELVSLFLPRDREVLTMRGKVRENSDTYKTQETPLDLDIPIAVLVNGGTASAAEITAGALQDYDRAIIVGQRTYGKGLVQESRPTPYNGVIKLTTSKYYIPSGRCIQAYKFEDGVPVHLPDSLAHEFHTAAGRLVHDGGGITPDIAVDGDSTASILYDLQTSDILSDYSFIYNNSHDVIASPATFHITDADYRDFCDFVKQKGFTFNRQSSKYLKQLRRLIEAEGFGDEARAELDALDAKLSRDVDADLQHWEKDIRLLIEANIMNCRYYLAGSALYSLHNAVMVARALDVLCDDALYRRTLAAPARVVEKP